MPDKNNESSGYRAYLIRLWPVRSRGRRVWRASAENAHNGERHAFADLAHLFTFLEEATQSDQVDYDDKEHPND